MGERVRQAGDRAVPMLVDIHIHAAAEAFQALAALGEDEFAGPIAGTPANADWLAADVEIDFDPVVVENPELTGSLDRSPAIVGGLKPRTLSAMVAAN